MRLESDSGLVPSVGSIAAENSSFCHPRKFLNNRFVYTVISSRAGGLSVGINLVPQKTCNFNCVYCEVNRAHANEATLDAAQMAEELKGLLGFIRDGLLEKEPPYRNLPKHLLELRQVALSGDGEPTLTPNFLEAIETVIHVRATSKPPPFKLVLITNGSGLDRPQVQTALKRFVASDEVWIKLDGGSETYLERINRSSIPLDRILCNTLKLAQQRPVVIQSLFPEFKGERPNEAEIYQYANRLKELKAQGAQIQLVQIYSAMRPSVNSECRHLPLKDLMQIARTVRTRTGLRAEVF